MRKKRILIVEDDPIIAISLSVLCKKQGYEVIKPVNNAKQAWELCLDQTKIPDLILLDINLKGDLKGTWVAQNIKDNNLSIKVIYLTAYNDVETVKEIVESNPHLYIMKPFNKKVLLSNLKIALSDINTDEIIELEDNHILYRIETRDILYIHSEGNYINIFSSNRKPIIIRMKLVDFHEKLTSQNFIRIHQSYIINKLKIKQVQRDFIIINNEHLPISRTYRKAVKDIIES